MVTVGIDPHKHVHVAVAVEAGGRRIGKPLTVGNDESLITVLLKWIRSITGDAPITCAIEDGRGFARRLADGLLLAGHEVVWVPTRLAAAHRKLHAATGAKSDQIDAAAVAHAAIATPGLDRHRIDECVRELRVLVDYRSDLVKRRTMAINQLKAQVHVWLDHTPGDLARARNLASVTTVVNNATLRPHVRQALIDMVTEIVEINRRVHDLDTAIRQLVTPLAPALLEVTGISHNSAAVLITEIGDISRFSTSAKLARYTGCAPIPFIPPTRNGTGCTEAATADSTVFSTPPRSCRNAGTQPRKRSWPATNRQRAHEEHDASSNATSWTSSIAP